MTHPEIAAYIAVRLDQLEILSGLLANDADSSNTRFCVLTDDERDVLAFIVKSKKKMIDAGRKQEESEDDKES